ncbi:MAG: hypothetical protein M3P40_08140 [Actinomycetota bacterium]|nr:hypothetical protein [Actinomycetota bacterium]
MLTYKLALRLPFLPDTLALCPGFLAQAAGFGFRRTEDLFRFTARFAENRLPFGGSSIVGAAGFASGLSQQIGGFRLGGGYAPGRCAVRFGDALGGALLAENPQLFGG